MPTNVKPEDLNVANYKPEIYDRQIRDTIPGHEELHRHIDQIIQRDYVLREKIRVLELGVGTGLTGERILRSLSNPEYFGVEFAPKMLAKAKERLSPYNPTLMEEDFALVKFPFNLDLIVSVIGIHHQETDEDKRKLFQKIYDSLAGNGGFILGDLVTYRDPTEAALNYALHYHHLVEHIANEQSLREWAHHHKNLNKLAPLEDQVEWLKEVGFKTVDVKYRKFNTALVYARK